MKKKNLMLAAAMVAIASTNTTAQTIPNGSFEKWVLKQGVEVLEGWTTSEELQCAPSSAGKSTDKADSSFAILLETSNCAQAGGIHEGFAIRNFAITKKPMYLKGSYKATRTNTDSCQVKVILKKGATEVGGATLNIYATQSTYKTFSLPIKYTSTTVPDKAEIYLFSDKIGKETMGSKLWVDKLSFSDTATGINDEVLHNKDITIFPNPAYNEVYVQQNSGNMANTYTITDQVGKVILSGTLTGVLTTINIEQLPKGFYLLQTDHKTGNSYKIIKH